MPKLPNKRYHPDGDEITNWRILLYSRTKGNVIGDTDFYGAMKKLVTGGYILGYLPLAYICGMTAEADHSSGWKSIALRAGGMLAGTAVLYLIGTVWFMKYTGMDLMASLAACVIPFLPGDVLKMAVVAVLAPRLENSVSHVLAASH